MSRIRLLKQIGSASIILTLGFVAQALSDVFLARHLPPAQYGFFTLIYRDAVNILVILTLLGIDSSLIRMAGPNPIESFKWKSLIHSSLFWFVPLAAIFGAIPFLLYDLTFLEYILLIAIVSILGGISIRASILRIQNRPTIAQFGLHIWKAIFAVGVIILFLVNFFSVTGIATTYVVCLGISLLILVVMLRRIPEGFAGLDKKKLLLEGLLIFGLSTSSMIMLKLERFFLAGMTTMADVGAYYALSLAVVTIYSIAASGSSYVLLPHFTKGATVKFRKNLTLLFALGIVMGFPYLLFGKEIVHLLFKGRYDEYVYLLPYFIVLGTLQLIYFLPSTFIGGKATTRTLRHFFYFGLITLVFDVLLCLLLIPRFGLVGAALSSIGGWLTRCLGGLWFARLILQQNVSHSTSHDYEKTISYPT